MSANIRLPNKAPADSRVIAGTKADRLFTRTGLASIMDNGPNGIVSEREKEIKRGIGAGSYSVAMVDKAGNPIKKDTSMNIGGRIFYPDANGVYTFIDRPALEYEAGIAAEVESYIDEIAYLACASDQNFAKVLNTDLATVRAICAKGGCATAKPPLDIGKWLDDEYSCLPSFLSLLPKESLIFAGGMAKLRAIIKVVMPIMDSNTHTKQAVSEEVQ